MKTNHFKIATLLLALLFLGTAPAALAQAGDSPDGLELTQEQKDQIQPLRIAHQKERVLLKARLREKTAHLKVLSLADNPDMNQINQTIDQITGLRNQMMKAQAAHNQKIRALLSDQQRTVFDSRRLRPKKNRRPPRPNRPGRR